MNTLRKEYLTYFDPEKNSNKFYSAELQQEDNNYTIIYNWGRIGSKICENKKVFSNEDYAIKVPAPGVIRRQDTMELGNYIRDVFEMNHKNKNFRFFGPDEALSNRLNHIFDENYLALVFIFCLYYYNFDLIS